MSGELSRAEAERRQLIGEEFARMYGGEVVGRLEGHLRKPSVGVIAQTRDTSYLAVDWVFG
jgi:hypothetical protein